MSEQNIIVIHEYTLHVSVDVCVAIGDGDVALLYTKTLFT